MVAQPRWTKAEAAILLEAVLNVENGLETRKNAIIRVSNLLRKMARDNGCEIDDKYRNENGITFQFQSMEYSAFGRVSGTQKNGSRLFDEVVALYNNDLSEYNKVLAAAHEFADGRNRKSNCNIVEEKKQVQFNSRKAFKEWLLSVGKTEERVNRIIDSFDQVSQYAIEKKIITTSLLDITDIKKFNKAVNTVQAYKFFRVLKKDLFILLHANSRLYVDYLKSANQKNTIRKENKQDCAASINKKAIVFSVEEAFSRSTKVEIVLRENFRRGFRPDSIMDRNRFIALYEGKYGVIISEESIINEVQKSCFRFDDRFFLPKALISKDTAQDMAEYISEYFSRKDVLFYNVLFRVFEEKFESYVYSPEMLASLLKKAFTGTRIYYSERYCSLRANSVPDISSEVINFLIQMDGPCSYDVIYGQLSHLNQKDIYNILHYNNPEIIGNSKVEYFHVKTAHLTDDELETLKDITSTLLSRSRFITCNEVMDSLDQNNHALMERLKSKFTILGIRRIFTYYLRSNFDVETGIITNKGMKMTVVDAFTDFASTRKHFTVDDVQNFSEYTGTVPYWDTIHKYAVRVNEKEFISDNDVDFDVDGIDDAIEHYCTDYIPLSEISDYSRFPSCGFSWNIFLLQQYVFRFSERFKLLSLGFSKSNVSGVIVRKQSGFDDFDSVVIDVLEKTKIMSPNDAIQYLCDKGFIAEKRYKKHVELLKVAIARRNNR